MKISKNDFMLLFSLHRSQPWLKGFDDQLLELFNECETLLEQKLLVNLLLRFCYLDADRHGESIALVCKQIVSGWGLDLDKTILVACTGNSETDSGQQVVYEVKNAMPHHGWKRPCSVNRYEKAQATVHQRPIVVLLDEFVGSGQTMSLRVKTMRSQFRGLGANDAKIYVAAYAGMTQSVDPIISAGCDGIFFSNNLKKGISEMSAPDVVAEDLEIMFGVESRLSQCVDSQSLPSLGYGQCEALYARYLGNIPNSVFPVFWWPFNAGENSRNTLFART